MTLPTKAEGSVVIHCDAPQCLERSSVSASRASTTTIYSSSEISRSCLCRQELDVADARGLRTSLECELAGADVESGVAACTAVSSVVLVPFHLISARSN